MKQEVIFKSLLLTIIPYRGYGSQE